MTTKIKAIKTFYHVYKNNTSMSMDVVENLEDNHLVIERFEIGKEYKVGSNISSYRSLFNKAEKLGLCKVLL